MSISESIEDLFEKGCSKLTIGKIPPQPNAPYLYVGCDQHVQMGAPGNGMIVNHQVAGESVANCLCELFKRVDQVKALERTPSGIVPIGQIKLP
jgi:hypothetical protein